MEGSSNCDIGCNGETVVMIPNQKTLNIDCPSSSDVDVSSMVSTKEGCESPLSSWDSEPENDISSITSSHIMPEEFLEDDGFSWEMDNKSYDELLKKFIEKEEELRVSNLKLQLSEQELAVQVENSENQLDEEKKNVAVLKRELETLVKTNEDNVINHHEELRKMIAVLFDLQIKKRELNSDIESLSKQKKQLTSKLEDCESRNKELEKKVKQYEAEKLKQNELHSHQVTLLQDDISYLTNKRLEGSFNYVFHPKKRNMKKR